MNDLGEVGLLDGFLGVLDLSAFIVIENSGLGINEGLGE